MEPALPRQFIPKAAWLSAPRAAFVHVECPSVGTIFAHSFCERSAMAVRLQFGAKDGPEPRRSPSPRRGFAVQPRRPSKSMDRATMTKVPIKYWRERAEKARAVADQMNDADSKRKMLRIAQD